MYSVFQDAQGDSPALCNLSGFYRLAFYQHYAWQGTEYYGGQGQPGLFLSYMVSKCVAICKCENSDLPCKYNSGEFNG